ncbi:MAG: hypothetical protein IJP66_01875, partial [Kiritimatiellae bacterium]|nr:hypothetical protein [Kiritimatiellia bacterium]
VAALCALAGLAPGASAPGRADLRETPPYRPSGPETGLHGAATGFFHVESIDGRDWPIDPTGRAVILAGCQHVKVKGVQCEALGYSPYGRFIETNYPSASAWADECLARLSDWGFTFLGNACTIDLLGHRTLPHVRNLKLGTRFATGDPDRYIRRHLNTPCTALPNVWHPDFAAACERIAAKECARERDDPWLIGWFIDNELAWWGASRRDLATGLYNAVAALPPEHSARQELDRWLEEFIAETQRRRGTPPAALAFLRHYARTYYEKTTAAIRKADPNHMILGSRYAGLDGAHPVVWEEAGRCCDIVTFNCYPWADLDRGVVLDAKDGVPMTERFREYYGYAGKPLMVTEWSFPALDTGRPCIHGAGQRFRTQAERAEATRLFARTMLSDPHVAGYDYFMWGDEPALGVREDYPEDSNYGLVNEQGVPYPEITAVFKELQGDLLKWRTAPPPEERGNGNVSHRDAETQSFYRQDLQDGQDLKVERSPPVDNTSLRLCASARDDNPVNPENPVILSENISQPVAAAEEEGSFVLSNGFVRISGAVGAPHLAELAFGGGEAVGRFGALLAGEECGTNYWLDVERLAAFSISRDAATGAGSITLRGEGPASGASAGLAPGASASSFAITARLTLAPGSREIAAELLSLENTGGPPITARLLFMRLFPNARDARPGSPPNVWKGPNEGAWRLPDGALLGLATEDPAALQFRFWKRAKDASLHPDAPFALAGDGDESALTLPPGVTYAPPRPFSARIFLRE